MCGIAGFTGFNNNKELAENSNIIQQHRGPDNSGVWSNDYIALAHRRLSIIDLSPNGNQPFEKHDLVIIFNGEIYNYKELHLKLEREKQVAFSSSSDTEVLLEMYRCYGKDCLNYLIGMFAFAIYDKKDNNLFIARDHFGIKPLFYTKIGKGFAFSSELKTLVSVPGFNKTINSKSLVSCLNYLWVSGNETMFVDCHKLPPAHFLIYHPSGKIEMRKYWEIDDKKMNNSNELAIKQELSGVFLESMDRHMVADVPVSSFLSGGLDSSLIAVLAKEKNDYLSTFTIGTHSEDKSVERMPDDEKYATELAKAYKIDHHIIHISPDILKDLPMMVKALDEPIGDPAAINTYLICKIARQRGVKVLLSGMGADEIFLGYRRQKATLMAIKYNKLPGFIKRIIKALVTRLPVRIFGRGVKFSRWSKRFLSFATLPVDEAYMRSYSYFDSKELRELLKPKYIPAIEQIKQGHKQLFNSKFKGDVVNQMCYVDTQMFMQGLNLTYSDRASMAASVEIRVPFIDKMVVTKAMQIPGNLKIKKGVSKYILKKVAENFLPKKIIYRPKASFGAPIRSWITKDLKPMIDDLLSEENINKRGFVDYSFVKKIINKDRSGEADYAYQIYQLLTLELWCREFIDH